MSRRAILHDIVELGLDPSKAHSNIRCNGHLAGTVVDVVDETVVEDEKQEVVVKTAKKSKKSSKAEQQTEETNLVEDIVESEKIVPDENLD